MCFGSSLFFTFHSFFALLASSCFSVSTDFIVPVVMSDVMLLISVFHVHFISCVNFTSCLPGWSHLYGSPFLPQKTKKVSLTRHFELFS